MITLTIIEGPDYRRDENGWEHNAYKVRLKRDGKSLTAPWMAGMAIDSPPSAEDVLAALLLDASGYVNAGGFEDWCAEYGYDALEDAHARKTYNTVARLTAKVRAFLGEDWDETSTEDAEDAARRLVNA